MEKDAVQPESTPESDSMDEVTRHAFDLVVRHVARDMSDSEWDRTDAIHVHIQYNLKEKSFDLTHWTWNRETLKTDPENDSEEKETVEPLNR